MKTAIKEIVYPGAIFIGLTAILFGFMYLIIERPWEPERTYKEIMQADHGEIIKTESCLVYAITNYYEDGYELSMLDCEEDEPHLFYMDDAGNEIDLTLNDPEFWIYSNTTDSSTRTLNTNEELNQL